MQSADLAATAMMATPTIGLHLYALRLQGLTA